MTIKTHKLAAGAYKVTDGQRTVMVDKVDFGHGDEWIAAAEWDRHLHTDPLPTKRDAVINARQMINDD